MFKRLVSFTVLAFSAGLPLAAQAIGWLYPLSVGFVSPTKAVAVRYDRTVAQLVEDIGYDEYELDIPEYDSGTKMKSPETVSCRYVVFSPFATPEQRALFLLERGLRPANFEELAAFSAAYPEERTKWNLVALGSEWRTEDGRSYVPVVGSFIKAGAQPDEPDWVMYSDPPRYDKKGRVIVLNPPLRLEKIEERKRYIALVRRDFLWTDEFDGPIAVVAVDDTVQFAARSTER